jgi:hypothetical protein
MSIKGFAASLVIGVVTVATFVSTPLAATSLAINQLQLTGETAVAPVVADSCPTKNQHTCSQQAVVTGAFGIIPAPVVAL